MTQSCQNMLKSEAKMRSRFIQLGYFPFLTIELKIRQFTVSIHYDTKFVFVFFCFFACLILKDFLK